MENDNRSPEDAECGSTASSMSFVLAEELDSLQDPRSSGSSSPEVAEVAIDSLAVMTRSQYAQVVFQDVADAYPNDTDIVCKFTLCLEPDPEVKLLHKKGDIVGIFKVPYVDPERVLCQIDVTDRDVSQGQGCVTFRAQQVPKEEDFYQFQYLRPSTGSEVRGLGASIPFQLRKPKSEELCAVHQGDSEFMMVQTSTALATGQLSDRIGDLQNEKEQLRESLTRTTTDYSKLLKLSEDLTEQLEFKTIANIELEKSLQTSRNDFTQLKSDVAALVQDKVLLEQRLHKSQDTVKALTAENDALVGKWRAQEGASSLLRDERDRLASKLEDTKAMMAALSDSKIMANRMIAEHVDKEQKMEEEMQKLREFAGQLQTKSTETTNKQSTDGLEKENESERLVNIEKRLVELQNVVTGSAAAAAAVRSDDSKHVDRLTSLETRLAELHNLVRGMDDENADKFSILRQDIDSLKSSVATSSFASGPSSVLSEEAGSTTMLHTDFIGRQLRESEVRDTATTPPPPVSVHCQTASVTAAAATTQTKGTEPAKDRSESGNGTPCVSSCSSSASLFPPSSHAPESSTAARVGELPTPNPLPIPILPVQTVEAMAAAARGGVRSIKQLLTSLSVEEGSTKSNEEAVPVPSSPSVCGPSAPPATALVVEEEESRSNVQVVLSDDGRPISVPTYAVAGQEEETNLSCPICKKTFEAGNVRQLEFHVEEHMRAELECPVCQAKYQIGSQRSFESHVASHFEDEDGAAPAQQQQRPGQQQQDNFWFLDFD